MWILVNAFEQNYCAKSLAHPNLGWNLIHHRISFSKLVTFGTVCSWLDWGYWILIHMDWRLTTGTVLASTVFGVKCLRRTERAYACNIVCTYSQIHIYFLLQLRSRGFITVLLPKSDFLLREWSLKHLGASAIQDENPENPNIDSAWRGELLDCISAYLQERNPKLLTLYVAMALEIFGLGWFDQFENRPPRV